MKNLKFLILIILPLAVFSVIWGCNTTSKMKNDEVENVQMRIAPYRILSDTLNQSYPLTEGKVTFQINRHNLMRIEEEQQPMPTSIRSSINGVWKTMEFDANGRFSYRLEPGTATFNFLLDSSYYEIIIPKIQVKAQHDVMVQLYFTELPSSKPIIMTEKPVVYVYSDEVIPLSIGLKPTGNLTFTYPQYNKEWKGIATGNKFEIDGKTYPYLFWEAENQANELIQWKDAAVISKLDVMNYLEAVSEKLKLNDVERTDFITYWGPRMMNYEKIEVLTVTNNIDELIGDLTVSNKAFDVNRMYLVFRSTSKSLNTWDLNYLAPFKRNKKMILEWGGSDFTNSES